MRAEHATEVMFLLNSRPIFEIKFIYIIYIYKCLLIFYTKSEYYSYVAPINRELSKQHVRVFGKQLF